MDALAETFGQFDLAFIGGPRVALPVEYTGAASTPSAVLPHLERAQSSSQIKEAAKLQELSPQDQQLANLYNPENPLRESYLRTKYQMFVNKHIRYNLASKIIRAKDQLGDLQHVRAKF